MKDNIHLVITGRRNTGKSSLINCILGQNKALVSDIAGTTTDPVKKSFEIPGLASVILIDTAGTDDKGPLGQLRVQKTFETIRQADAAILVITANQFGLYEEKLIREFTTLNLPFLILHNKSDQERPEPALKTLLKSRYNRDLLAFSTLKPDLSLLIEAITHLVGKPAESSLLGSLLSPGQIVMLVTPIDSEAPTGRLILPQVQMLRDILDNRCISVVLQPGEIPDFFCHAVYPDLVVTDSQAFAEVASLLPENIPLTSFSIVLAHHKGNFQKYLSGTLQIARLQHNDKILILESCSHHISCEDIGRIKIPALLQKCTGKKLEFDFIAGLDRIQCPFTDYALIIQCGGCMVSCNQLRNRLKPAIEAGIPVSNYGMTLAYVQGIFERAIKPFFTYHPNPSV